MSEEFSFPRSQPIIERWRAEDHQPSFEEKADYWRCFAADAFDALGTDKTRLRFAIGQSVWARTLAGKTEKKLEALERRLAALEQRLDSERKGFFYRGTWAAGESYEQHDFVTDGGSMWCCLAPTATRPGTSDDWQLAVKAGRDRRR